MVLPHRMRFVLAQVTWLVGGALVLSAAGLFSYGLFVLLSVLGFVVVADVLTLSRVRPRWYGRVRLFVTIGLVGAAVVLGFRFVQLFAPGVVP